MTEGTAPARPASYDKKVGLVLQGGGALGSYQAGVYEALASSEYMPDWVADISIGAINAAIIAGNAPKDRVHRLRRFWEEITAPTKLWPQATGALAAWQRWTSAVMAISFGQPGFFNPSAWSPSDKQISYYSTSALKATLERLVDFDRINVGNEMRLSVGAVNVETGDFTYFDSREMTIRVEHVMASGALPPGFPPVEIDGEQYWDGGLFSNTPLQYMVDYYPRRSRVIIQVDLFPAHAHHRPKISMRCTNAIRTSVIPAEPDWRQIRCANGTTLDTRSMSCISCCRRRSRAPNRPDGSTATDASRPWTSCS